MQSCTGAIYSYHDTEKTKLDTVYYRIGGLIEGQLNRYYSNGQLMMTCNYTAGKLDGEFRTYYANGRLQSVCNYIDGLRDGEYRSYHISGRPWSMGKFVAGLRVGTFKYYSPNGHLKVNTYVNDVLAV